MSLANLIEKPAYLRTSTAREKYSMDESMVNALTAESLSATSLASSLASILNNEKALLYSVNIVSPPNVERFIDKTQLPSSLPAEALKQFVTGYFYNEEIRKCSTSDFQRALFAITRHAKEVEIAARPDENKPMLRHRVLISQTA